MARRRLSIGLVGFLLTIASAACAVSPPEADKDRRIAVDVPGRANLMLAGAPFGAQLPTGDSAPAESPVAVDPGFVVPGTVIRFSAVGGAGNTPGYTAQTADGNLGKFVAFEEAPTNGISNIHAPIGGLIGVFLPDAASPAPLEPPVSLDYREPELLNAGSLAPSPGQVFFIGDGLSEMGAPIGFRVPMGASRLYLGVMDGTDWQNNTGGMTVTVIAEVIGPAPTAARDN